MRARVALSGLCCGLLAISLSAAQTAPISIWYRSTESCPNGAQFVALLGELGRAARLANAGDPIDFVVTLGEDGPESMGRLERQTNQGTIAIRNVSAAECSAVADALAFSLDLALDPAKAAEPEPEPSPVPRDDTTVATSDTPAATARPRSPARASAPPQASTVAATQEARPAPAAGGTRVGAQVELLTALVSSALFGAAVFVDYELAPQALGLRLTAHAAAGSSTRDGYGLESRLLAGRLDACPLAWNATRLQLRPCIAAEAGAMLVDYSSPAGVRDVGPWFSAWLLGRARWSASARVAVEGSVGASAPLIHYEITDAQGHELARTRAVGVIAAVGVAFGPW